MYRITLNEEDFNGVKVPPGSKLMLNFGSANRDEKYYPAGEEFDLDRDNSETLHLSFGRGIHACAGQAFARKEAIIAVERLINRCPDLKLSSTLPPERASLFGVRGFRTLNVEFTPTARRA
jgi:cytochrome P450